MLIHPTFQFIEVVLCPPDSDADAGKAQQRPIGRGNARTSCSLCARRLSTVLTILRKANTVKPRALHGCLHLRRPNVYAAPPNNKHETAVGTAEGADTSINVDTDMRDAERIVCVSVGQSVNSLGNLFHRSTAYDFGQSSVREEIRAGSTREV